MRSPLNRIALTVLSAITFGSFSCFFSKLGSKKFIEQLSGKATDEFLELLLKAMDLAFCLIKDYGKNIKTFSGRYCFCTSDKLVGVSAVFQNGQMTVYDNEIKDWNVKIIFNNAGALRNYLFSKDQDILNSLLANEVEVIGNLNYIYKFGFMVRELAYKFGIK